MQTITSAAISRTGIKITLSLACIIFFFIGAPLGAIIRKGGLGMPVVISVLIFVLYYIIDSGATRVAKSGEMNIVLGTWMSTIILAPLGGFLTYKSNKDSVVFNIDVYAAFFRKILGIRVSRHIFKKKSLSIHQTIIESATIWTHSAKNVKLTKRLTNCWGHQTIIRYLPTTSTTMPSKKSANKWKA